MNTLQKVESLPLEYSKDKLELLTNTVCKGATHDELQLFLHVCKRTGLDPFMKQIYSISRQGQRTIQTSIDGLRLIAERTGKYSPGKEVTYNYGEDKKLISSTAFVKKMTPDGTWHEISCTAFYSEYVQSFADKKTGRYEPGKFWKQMPHVMLAKCAEAGALRKAFPAEMSGLYGDDEMMQAEKSKDQALENIEEAIVEEVNKMSENDIESYIHLWADQRELFRVYMKEVMKIRNWTETKAISVFQKDPQQTKNSFENWANTQKFKEETVSCS
jgi:phage recombination protein Bet